MSDVAVQMSGLNILPWLVCTVSVLQKKDVLLRKCISFLSVVKECVMA